MSYDKNLNTIKGLLNSSTAQLSPTTLEKLRSARTHALDHRRTHTSPVLAWVSSHGGFKPSFHFSKSTNLALAVIFAACIFSAASYWQSYTKDNDTTDVDIAILTDDLPIHVFLD